MDMKRDVELELVTEETATGPCEKALRQVRQCLFLASAGSMPSETHLVCFRRDLTMGAPSVRLGTKCLYSSEGQKTEFLEKETARRYKGPV